MKPPVKTTSFLIQTLIVFCLISSISTAKIPSQTTIATLADSVNTADSLALVALYTSTAGVNWTFRTNWLIGSVSTWHGIKVVNGRVTEINLFSNNLIGPLPPEIKDLTALISLKLQSNQLNGNLPSGIGQLINLTILNLSSNRFTGSLPSELRQMTNLIEFQASSNSFSGALPSEFGQLKKLKTLYLHYNLFVGSIPTTFIGMTSIERLYLNNNLLSGSIPPELGLLPNLQLLMLNNNSLSGTIPSSLGLLSKLSYLYLHFNKLTGSIPSQLGDMVGLYYLNLNNNALRGEIPSSLGNLKNLRQCYLQVNQLRGAIPPELSKLSNLQILNLSINQLSSWIPIEFSNLKNLTLLDLSLNQLSGTIPAELGQLGKLTQLSLDRNMLTGDIPSEINNLIKLENLSLTSNQLSGFLPDMLHTLPNLSTISVYYNNLTFEDFEDKKDLFDKYFYYSPQYNIGQKKFVSVDEGDNYTMNVICGGSRNRYQWFLNEKPLGGANENADFRLVNITADHIGQYHCLVTNELIPDLILKSEPIVIQFKPIGEFQPTDIFLSNAIIDENLPIGTKVGILSTEDDDIDDWHFYTLVEGEGSEDNINFYIAANQLHTSVEFDFELKSFYNIRVQTEDGAGNVLQKVFTIDINDIKELLPSDIVISANSIDEFLPPGTEVGIFSTVSNDSIVSGNFSYSLVNGEGDSDNNSFYIFNDRLHALLSFEYLVKESYLIRIQTLDEKGNSFQKVFTIYINDILELPISDLLLSNDIIDENQPVGTYIGSFSSLSDLNSHRSNFTYTLVPGEGGIDNSSFFIAADQLHSGRVFNYEFKNLYEIRVQSVAPDSTLFQKSLIISVNDIDDTNHLIIPDAFSPNGDGKNDYFIIPGIENFAKNEINIYNRYGKLVFSATNYGLETNGLEPLWWDGCLRTKNETSNKVLPEGYYFVVVKIDLNTIYKNAVFLKE
jgi:gliding motility-associated-like protein